MIGIWGDSRGAEVLGLESVARYTLLSTTNILNSSYSFAEENIHGVLTQTCDTM
jgi:hypothetical protein